MVAIPQIKEKIVDLLRIKGPSLPIQLSREINISSLFVSAFLSELTDEKKIKVSSLKVGGSPLYFLEGQELQLEKFYNYLHPKEGEAFLLIRENKILKDSDQDPAIRVALRAIRDFSAGFTKNNEIYWRYLQIPESEAYKLIDNKYSTRQVEPEQKQEPKEEKREVIIQEEIKQDEPKQIIEPPKSLEIVPESKQEPTPKKTKTPKTKLPKIIETSVEKEFANPLANKPIEKPKKEKEKSEFVLNTIEFLKNNHFKIIEEKDHKAKEYLCITQINTPLGPINFLTEAKDKKSISDTDLQKFLSTAQAIPLPALVLYTGELNKKAQEYLEKYTSILKAKKIE